MEKKRLLNGTFAAFALLILIIDGKTALIGAQSGIDLCLKTVIPCLFPFFVLSIMLTNSLSGIHIPFSGFLANVCRIPVGTESILIPGFLGGYPVGAQAIGTAYSCGQLTRKDAIRLLSFCSNAGPAFLFGMVSSLFDNKKSVLLLWIIHITSALMVAIFQPVSLSSHSVPKQIPTVSLPEALHKAVSVTATVCSWVILFRILINFINTWILWLFPVPVQVVFTGFVELTNGCYELSRITNLNLRFVLCSGMLAWGGICVMMQTKSVSCGLPIRSYVIGKFLQCIMSILFSISIVLRIWLPVTVFLLILVTVNQIERKRSGNPAAVGV